MGYKVVVAGATGNVGREMLNILAERQFPVDELAALASRRSLGTEVSFGDKTLTTQDIDTFDFKPALRKIHGTELPDSIRQGQRLTGMTSGQRSFPCVATCRRASARSKPRTSPQSSSLAQGWIGWASRTRSASASPTT